MPVNFGLWYDFRNPAQWRRPFGRMYAEYLDQIVRAEAAGFGSVWLTEHHFCEDGYTPSPLVIAGAIGARTSRMRIGTNLIVLPLHDPVEILADGDRAEHVIGGHRAQRALGHPGVGGVLRILDHGDATARLDRDQPGRPVVQHA